MAPKAKAGFSMRASQKAGLAATSSLPKARFSGASASSAVRDSVSSLASPRSQYLLLDDTYKAAVPKAKARTSSSTTTSTKLRAGLVVGGCGYAGPDVDADADVGRPLSPAEAEVGLCTERAGGYKKEDLVEYSSSAHKGWFPATVIEADSDDRIPINQKPDSWIAKDEQAAKVRPPAGSDADTQVVGGEAQGASSRLTISRSTITEILQDDFASAIQVEDDYFAVGMQTAEVARTLNISVINFAGETVGKFVVEASETVRQLKVDHLASYCNAEVWHLTLLHEELILEDHSRWTDAVMASDPVIVTLLIELDPLQDDIIIDAVDGFCRGDIAKDEAERKYGHISRWDTSRVTTMSNLFTSQEAFNEDLSAWNVSNVTDMSCMFRGAASFNGDLSAWDVGNVLHMNSMFRRATSFNGDLSIWNVDRVRTMYYMFAEAESFNGDLSAWNVSNATHMKGMFWGAKAFNGDLSAWNVSKVKSMEDMFYGASMFNNNLSKWTRAPFP